MLILIQLPRLNKLITVSNKLNVLRTFSASVVATVVVAVEVVRLMVPVVELICIISRVDRFRVTPVSRVRLAWTLTISIDKEIMDTWILVRDEVNDA